MINNSTMYKKSSKMSCLFIWHREFSRQKWISMDFKTLKPCALCNVSSFAGFEQAAYRVFVCTFAVFSRFFSSF